MAWAASEFAQPSPRKVRRPGEGEAGGYVLVIPVPIGFAAIGLTGKVEADKRLVGCSSQHGVGPLVEKVAQTDIGSNLRAGGFKRRLQERVPQPESHG